MLGKLVQLLGIPLEDGFEVVYGVDFSMKNKVHFDFATLQIMYTPWREYYNVVHCWEFSPESKKDGFITFWLNNNETLLRPQDVEERLWVIIPYSTVRETTAKQIAGRYPEEAILEMKAGDTLKVSKGGKPESYMAVQAGNELFLVKKSR